MAATQEQIDLALMAVGAISGPLNIATVDGRPDALAAMVAAFQLGEKVAQAVLQGQIGQGQINEVKAAIQPILGPPWSD